MNFKSTFFLGCLFAWNSSNAQNVGIGTTTPTEKLHVEGNLRVTGLGGVGNAVVLTDNNGVLSRTALSGNNTDVFTGAGTFVPMSSFADGWKLLGNSGTDPATNFLGTIDAIDFVIRTANTERMRVTSLGFVGVGTNAPNSPFTIRTSSAAANARTSSLANAIGDMFFELATARGAATNSPGDITTQIGQAYNGGLITEGMRFHRGIAAADGAISFSTSSTERMRILSNGNVGIGLTNPAYNLEINGSFGYGNGTAGVYRSRTETRDNAGLQASQSGFFETSNPVNYPAGASGWWHLLDVRHSNNANNYALQIAGSFFDQDLWFRKTNGNGAQAWSRLLTSTSGWAILGNAGTNAAVNFIGTTDNIDFVTRTNNIERMRVTTAGNVGIGTPTPAANARLQVIGGAIMPATGNANTAGIYFPTNPGGGGGDEAYIRHYVEAGENTKLVIANVNDPDDDISFRTGLTANERLQINGNGTVYINRGVLFDCNDCGAAGNGQYDLADGAGGNWGDLSIQGRVLSTNSNLHLSPPGGFRVIINSVYRAAGGGTGTTGLDIEDGGIRMRKNYRWINRYGSTGGYGWGSQTHNLGNWDFCAIGHVGFRNTNSATDEDDDVQCAVYPQAHVGPGEGDLWDAWFTYQYNARPLWFMYLEGFADTNATNCAATCINFD